jgi:hypothetical protein
MSKKNRHVGEDPVYVRWRRQYPRFPGVAKCVELLGRGNVWGYMVDVICDEPKQNAATHADELIAAFRDPKNTGLQLILLGVICEARLPEALPVFVEYLHAEDERYRCWSERGLRELNTPEARKALWEASLEK